MQEVHVNVEFKEIIFYNFAFSVYLARFIQALRKSKAVTFVLASIAVESEFSQSEILFPDFPTPLP